MTDPIHIQEKPPKFNAHRHGVTGQVIILTPEDEAAYKSHCQTIHDGLAPVGGMELELAQDIADGRWRIKIAAAMQINVLAIGVNDNDAVAGNHPEVDTAVKQARAFMKRGGSFNLLSLYERRLQSKTKENLAQLFQIQEMRRVALKEVVEEVAVIAQEAEAKGQSFDVERDYPIKLLYPQFVFSAPEIVRLVTHNRRREAAKQPLRMAA